MSAASTAASLDDAEVYPTVARTCPSTADETTAVVNFLSQVWEVSAVAVLYVGDTFGASMAREIQERAASQLMTTVTVPFSPKDVKTSIPTALQRIHASRFRYIVCISFDEEYQLIMEAAHAAGLTNDDHVWLFYGLDENAIQRMTSEKFSHDSVVGQATKGLGIFNLATGRPANKVRYPGEPRYGAVTSTPESAKDRFRLLWSTTLKETEFLDYMATKLPKDVEPRSPSELEPSSTWSFFLYDAVISMGIALCQVASLSNQTILDVSSVMSQFQNMTFSGASGNVAFTQAQTRSSAQFTLWNILPMANETTGYSLTPAAHDENGGWSVLQPFVFQDETTKIRPSLLSNDISLENFNDPTFSLGLLLSGICVTVGTSCAVWTFLFRKSSVVSAAQPTFLYFIALGIVVFGLALLPRTWYRWGDWGKESNFSCQAGFWVSFVYCCCGLLKAWQNFSISFGGIP